MLDCENAFDHSYLFSVLSSFGFGFFHGSLCCVLVGRLRGWLAGDTVPHSFSM